MNSFINQEDIYNLVISRTPMAMTRDLSANFKLNQIPITKEQFSILVVLWKEEGCSQQYLADKTYRDKPGITRLIDNLEKEQFVRRQPDPNDRRSNLIFLTQKGKDLESEVTGIVRKSIEKALRGIDEQDAIALKRILERVYQNLQKD